MIDCIHDELKHRFGLNTTTMNWCNVWLWNHVNDWTFVGYLVRCWHFNDYSFADRFHLLQCDNGYIVVLFNLNQLMKWITVRLIAYTIFYTVASMSSELPWNRCQQWWGADQFCFSRSVKTNETSTYYDIDDKTLYYNGTRVCKPLLDDADCVNVTLQTASRQYWE